jgi:gluconolactonase
MTLRSTAVLFALGAVVAGCGGSPDSTPSADPASSPAESSVVRLDPALDAIVPPGAEVEKVADGFQFTEGPLWHPGENRLWFSDVVGNVLRAVTPDGEVEVLLEESGGPSTAPPGSYIGSNGLLFEEGGSVLMTQHASRRIVRVGPDRELSVVVDRHDGKRLNSPNDLAFGPDGALYFTDPPFGLVGQDEDPEKELEVNGVYRFAGGETTLLIDDLGRPNGIAFSPDGRTMYVSNTEASRKVVMAYDVAPDGTVSNARVFADGTADDSPGMPDGLKVDTDGNVYATMPGGVWVLTPEGRHLGTIRAPEVAANVGWGDDGHSLYITAETGIYRIRLSTRGF